MSAVADGLVTFVEQNASRTGTWHLKMGPLGKLAGHYHDTYGMAIANIRERLQLHFDAEAQLNAEVTGERYVVTILIPAEKQEV